MGFLSSLFGVGGGSKPATNTNVVQQQLPKEISPFVTEIAKEAQDLFKERVAEGYTPYTGQTIAPLTPQEEAAMTGIEGLVGTSRPLQEEALGVTRQQAERFTPESAQAYMSPYQNEVMDATLSEFDRQQTIGQQGLRDRAIQAGAYGGGREGIMQAEYMNQGAMNRAQLQAQLLNQGFQQAQAARGADLQARQGLGTYQSALGQEQQQYDQALKDATQIANREQQFQPFTQMGLIGQQLAQIQPGAFATQTVGPATAGPVSSPMSQFLGGAAGAAGIMGKLGIFG